MHTELKRERPNQKLHQANAQISPSLMVEKLACIPHLLT